MTVVAVVLNAAIFILAFRIATASKLSVRDVAPGAVVAAVIWQLLQLFGTAYVTNVVKDANTTYGVFAVVLGLLVWIFLAALGVVLSVEINVVRTKNLFPRALLTPFTDNVDLTGADQRAYTDAATAQRHKGFETVDVTFDHEGQEAAARKRADNHLGTNRNRRPPPGRRLTDCCRVPVGEDPTPRGNRAWVTAPGAIASIRSNCGTQTTVSTPMSTAARNEPTCPASPAPWRSWNRRIIAAVPAVLDPGTSGVRKLATRVDITQPLATTGCRALRVLQEGRSRAARTDPHSGITRAGYAAVGGRR